MSNQLIYTGKAKDIYSTEDENVIKSVYKDQATMLNGARKETIKGKGVLNNQISSLIFEKLNAAGVATHFIERISDTEQLNKKVKIIPLEVVLRNVTAGLTSNWNLALIRMARSSWQTNSHQTTAVFGMRKGTIWTRMFSVVILVA